MEDFQPPVCICLKMLPLSGTRSTLVESVIRMSSNFWTKMTFCCKLNFASCPLYDQTTASFASFLHLAQTITNPKRLKTDYTVYFRFNFIKIQFNSTEKIVKYLSKLVPFALFILCSLQVVYNHFFGLKTLFLVLQLEPVKKLFPTKAQILDLRNKLLIYPNVYL